MTERTCGSGADRCSLCCKLLPVDNVETVNGRTLPGGWRKGANERCRYQRATGCRVYGRVEMPTCCRLFVCRWLVNDDTAELRRPDRSHYVVDVTPDIIVVQENEGSPKMHLPVIQVWVDPAHREAYKDPALLAYLDRQGATHGTPALIRYSGSEGFVLFPPSMSEDREWHEQRSAELDETTTLQERMAAAGLGLIPHFEQRK